MKKMKVLQFYILKRMGYKSLNSNMKEIVTSHAVR